MVSEAWTYPRAGIEMESPKGGGDGPTGAPRCSSHLGMWVLFGSPQPFSHQPHGFFRGG